MIPPAFFRALCALEGEKLDGTPRSWLCGACLLGAILWARGEL